MVLIYEKSLSFIHVGLGQCNIWFQIQHVKHKLSNHVTSYVYLIPPTTEQILLIPGSFSNLFSKPKLQSMHCIIFAISININTYLDCMFKKSSIYKSKVHMIFSVYGYPQIANDGHKILSCLTEWKGLHNYYSTFVPTYLTKYYKLSMYYVHSFLSSMYIYFTQQYSF